MDPHNLTPAQKTSLGKRLCWSKSVKHFCGEPELFIREQLFFTGDRTPRIFTIIDAGLLVLKVEDGGELGDAELGGKLRVVRLDELDANGVGVVVYLLQLLDGFVASGTVRSVCNTFVC